MLVIKKKTTMVGIHRAPRQQRGCQCRSYLMLLVFGVILWFINPLSEQRQNEEADQLPPSNDRGASPLGAIIILAPQRNQGSIFNLIDRFCFLIRAVRSIDEHINSHYGPYPIYVLVAKDYNKDIEKVDAPYTEKDRELIRSWAPHSTVNILEINMYSEDAVSPGITQKLIEEFQLQQEKWGIPPVKLGYASMCRLWSFRLQSMDFLTPFKYYMRLDDDSLLTGKPGADPFLEMEWKNLTYAWRRNAADEKGVAALMEVAPPYIADNFETPFVQRGGDGHLVLSTLSPYNNFHISRVDFWRSQKWLELMQEVDKKQIFYQYKLGDAATHAMATSFMTPGAYEMWGSFPYAHNSNDLGSSFGNEEYKQECKQAYEAAGIPVPKYELPV
jgi:hypothetical protein